MEWWWCCWLSGLWAAAAAIAPLNGNKPPQTPLHELMKLKGWFVS